MWGGGVACGLKGFPVHVACGDEGFQIRGESRVVFPLQH